LNFEIQDRGQTVCRKGAKKIPKPDRSRICEKIDSLSEELPNPVTTKMKGENPFHRVHVGDYRIIYEIHDEVLVILIVKVGHRKDIYRNLS